MQNITNIHKIDIEQIIYFKFKGYGYIFYVCQGPNAGSNTAIALSQQQAKTVDFEELSIKYR